MRNIAQSTDMEPTAVVSVSDVPKRPTERGSSRPLLTFGGPVLWTGGGQPGGSGLRY